MARVLFIGAICALSAFFFAPLSAQSIDQWQDFTLAADNLPESAATSISLAPDGTVIARHPMEDRVSLFDGYQVNTIPAPDSGMFRVYSDGDGRLWSLHADGLQEYREGAWRFHPVMEIRNEMAASSLRRVRQIPLHPLRGGFVLVLLGDQLLKYDAQLRQSEIVVQAAGTWLESFTDFGPSHDGGIWVSGRQGLARIAGPLSAMNPEIEWISTPHPPEGLTGFQRPVEAPAGVVTMVAQSVQDGRRVQVQFSQGEWSVSELPDSSIRQTWQDENQRNWALGINTLWTWLDNPELAIDLSQEGLQPDPFSDLVYSTNMVFWLSSPTGLWRYTPRLWRVPLEVPDGLDASMDVVQDRTGRFWVLGEDRLWSWMGSESESFELPGNPGVGEGAPVRLFLDDGRTPVFSLLSGTYRFETETGTFQGIEISSADSVKALGTGTEGIYLMVESEEGLPGQKRLVRYRAGELFEIPPLPAAAQTVQWRSVLSSGGNELWLGTDEGPWRLSEGEWERVTPPDRDEPLRILCMVRLDNDRIWFGTEESIEEFDGRNWTTLLMLRRVQSMTIDTLGRIWIASSEGLYCHQYGSPIPHGREEGITGTIVHDIYQDRAGRIWAATGRGLRRYFPEADNDPPQASISQDNLIRQVSSRNPYIINFTGKDRWRATSAQRLHYSWRVDDSEWSPFTQANTVTFPSETFGPGNHLFEVRAMDRNFNVSVSPATWEFAVVVPWFQDPRLVAIMALAVVAVGIFASLAVNRHLRLTRSHAEIEKIVEERTRQLEQANRELAHAEKMRSLGTLAAGVAHDFNSILSIIRGSIQIIESNPGNASKVNTRVERIKNVVEQGSMLVKAMLGFSRADDAALVLRDIRSVVEDSVQLLGDRIPESVQVSITAEPDLPPVHGTRELIQQILVNLILNALDAMEGEGSLQLRTRMLDRLPAPLVKAPAEAGRYVGIEVADSGCGMSGEQMRRIFEPFFTTKSFSTRHGTGLGLSMVYEFSKELGYGLNVRSTPGKGTTFIIIVPVPDTVANSR